MLCKYIKWFSVVSFVIGTLGVFGLIHHLDLCASNGLKAVQSKLKLTFANSSGYLGSFVHFVFLIVLGFLFLDYGLKKVIIFFTLEWSPSGLIYDPQFGYYALGFGLLIRLIIWFAPKSAKPALRSFFDKINGPNANYFLNTAFWSYVFLVVALLAPYIIFNLFDHKLPVEFFLWLVLFPFVKYIEYLFYFGVTDIFLSLIGIGWLIIFALSLILDALDRSPQRVLGTIGYLLGGISLLAPYWMGLC